jgi:hypothetical protein
LAVMLTSGANCASGLVLVATWATMWPRVPIIVLCIGGSLLIQGAYTILYVHDEFGRLRALAAGALLAGEALAACAGAALLVEGVIHNVNNADMEMAPVLAGFLMLVQALVALVYLLANERLRARVN